MNGREITYATLAILGLVSTWFFNIQYALQGGDLLNLPAFFAQGFANAGSSSLTVDLFVAFAAFVIWVGPEAKRLGMPHGWLYPVLGLFIAFAFAFPLFLLMRERHLRKT